MSWKIFKPLSSQIDEVTKSFITDMTAKSITMLKPVIIAGLTLSFIFYSLLIVRGLVEVPITEFFSKCVRIGPITSFICVGGFYQFDITDLIQKLPDAVATALLKDKSQEKGSAMI